MLALWLGSGGILEGCPGLRDSVPATGTQVLNRSLRRHNLERAQSMADVGEVLADVVWAAPTSVHLRFTLAHYRPTCTSAHFGILLALWLGSGGILEGCPGLRDSVPATGTQVLNRSLRRHNLERAQSMADVGEVLADVVWAAPTSVHLRFTLAHYRPTCTSAHFGPLLCHTPSPRTQRQLLE